MATSLFDSAPEYDSDLDTLADFVLEPTTTTPIHVPPPPSPLPDTCLCGQTTREADTDEQLYCSEACARLDAFHALTARSRSNSLAPTPATTAPTTPLGMNTPLRESLAILFAPNDSPHVSMPLSASSSHTSFETAALPLEMSSHYRRVHAKRERMERHASRERERSRSHSRAHSRTHSKASPSLGSLREECHVEVEVEREAGHDGEDGVPAPTALCVHVAVDVQIEHHFEHDIAIDERSEARSLGPAPGVEWRDPFADPSPCASLSSHDLSLAPHDVLDLARETDVLSITESELSPFVTYAPVAPPPPGLRTRKSSVCFAGLDGRIPRSDAKSRSRASSLSVFAQKPLPPTPGWDHPPPPGLERSLDVSESTPIAEPSTMAEAPEPVNLLSSPALTMDSPFQPDDASLETPAEPTTPVSSTAPASPCTPNARIHEPQSGADLPSTPARSSSAPAPSSPVAPAMIARPQKPEALDALARTQIFSMVIDPELDVFSAQVVGAVASPSAPLKRSETAPELALGWGPDGQPTAQPQAPTGANRARATSTPRRGGPGGRQRTTSTPAHPQLGQLQMPPRRARLQHIPPPTPPVSPSQVSSPRPVVGQDPGSWLSFGAAFDTWSSVRSPSTELHRRQESGESTASSATDASWDSGSGDAADYWRGRARSPATSSVRTVVPPPRGSSLARYDVDDKDQLHVPRRSRRHSSIAALDSILAMEETFWSTETPVLVRDSDEGEGESQGVAGVGHDAGVSVSVTVNKFTGDAGGFAFPSEKPKLQLESVLRIAGASLLSPSPPRSRRGSGVRFDAVEHAHRLTPAHFSSSPSVGYPNQEPAEPSPVSNSHLFDAPVSASPLLISCRNSPALPNASPLSTHFSIRTPNSPYLSVNRRGSRSTDASSVLMRTASAARLAAALNAAPENDDEDEELARFGTRARRSGSLGQPSPRMGLGLALGEEHVRARANSESWLGLTTVPGIGTMSRSGSRMNLLNPTTSIVVEEEEEEDYGQVVDSSKFSGIVTAAPASLSGEESSPLIDAFPHPMGGYFPGSRFASRANTPVRSLHGSNSALSLRQVAAGQAQPKDDESEEHEDPERDEDEEIVTTVQRMRHSMQLLGAA